MADSILRLPDEIISIIVTQLNPPTPLFVPGCRSLRDYDTPELYEKLEQHYGLRTRIEEGAEARAEAFANFVKSCSRLYRLFAPRLFHTVAIRNTSRSLASVKALSQGPNWQFVKSILLADVYDSEPCDREQTQMPLDIRGPHCDTDNLHALAHLPPNLAFLSLDFPLDWKCFERHPVDAEITDSVLRYRKLVENLISLIAENDLSAKPKLYLRIRNFSRSFRRIHVDDAYCRLFRSVTNLETLFCPSSVAMMSSPTAALAQTFAYLLREVLFDHLDEVTTLTLSGNRKLPLGMGYGWMHMYLPHRTDNQKLANIRHLTLHHAIISTPLVALFAARVHKLRSLTLQSCHIDAGRTTTSQSTSPAPTWCLLFTALVPTTTLTTISVTFSAATACHAAYMDLQNTTIAAANGAAQMQRRQAAEAALKQDQSLEQAMLTPRNWPYVDCRRVMGDDRWEKVDLEVVYRHWVLGDDHRAWIALLEVVERNRSNTEKGGE